MREEEEEEGNHLILAKSVFSISGVMIYTDTWHTAPPLNTFLHRGTPYLPQPTDICSSAVINTSRNAEMLCSRSDGSSDNTTVQLMTEEIK